MNSEEFKKAAKASIDHIIDYYETLPFTPSVVSTTTPNSLRTLLPTTAPFNPEPWPLIHSDIDTLIKPGLTHWQHPSFFAFFPCPTSYPSILGEMYSAAFGGAFFNWICSPAVTELETVVLDWLAKILGLPEEYLSTGRSGGGGVVMGTASESILTVMVAAREKYLRETLPGYVPANDGDKGHVMSEEVEEELMRKRARLVVLGSSATHSSTKKAARILGVRYVAVPVTRETDWALTPEAVKKVLEECKSKGWEPFFMTLTLGTTDTCAVDDFAGIQEVLEDFHKSTAQLDVSATHNGVPKTNGHIDTADDDTISAPAPFPQITTSTSQPPSSTSTPTKTGEIWIHIDAAYAGSALVLPSIQSSPSLTSSLLQTLGHFHSFNVNMHKWLLTNFDASCLYIRSRAWLESALAADLHIYKNSATEGGLVTDYRNWQIPLGRRFRALKIWFVLRTYGVRGLREYIDKGITMCEGFAEDVRKREDLFEIVAGPRFALVVFSVRGEHLEEENKRTLAVAEEVNATGKLWLTTTMLEGKAAIRVMTANRLTEDEHVRHAFKLIEAAAEKQVQASSKA